MKMETNAILAGMLACNYLGHEYNSGYTYSRKTAGFFNIRRGTIIF